MTFTELPREAKAFRPGGRYRYLDFGDDITDHRPETIAYAAIAGNHRAVEFLRGDATIPQFHAKPLSEDIECAKCGESKSRSAFRKDTRKHNGLHSYCKQCERVQKKVYRLRRASWFEDVNGNSKRRVNEQKSA